jgi:hypothetical protein
MQLLDFWFYLLKKINAPKPKGNVLHEAWGAKGMTRKPAEGSGVG